MLRLTFPVGDLIIDHRSALAPVQSLHCLDSEDEVRRLLLIALNNPTALDRLRRFFAQWNSEAWRVTVIKDRTLIERVARMTVNGPLAAFTVYNKPTLNTAQVAANLASAELAQRARGAGGAPAHASHAGAAPPAGVTGPAPSHRGAGAPAGAGGPVAVSLDFTILSREQRFEMVLSRTSPHLPKALRAAFGRLLDSDTRITTIGVLMVWGGSHTLGIEFIVDSLLSMTSTAFRGAAMIGTAEDLRQSIEYTLQAREDKDLDVAAKLLADVVTAFGVDGFTAMILHGATRVVSSSAKGKKAERERPRPGSRPFGT